MTHLARFDAREVSAGGLDAVLLWALQRGLDDHELERRIVRHALPGLPLGRRWRLRPNACLASLRHLMMVGAFSDSRIPLRRIRRKYGAHFGYKYGSISGSSYINFIYKLWN